MKSIVQVTNK